MIKIRKNKLHHLDLLYPMPFSASLKLGKSFTYEQKCAIMEFTADGVTEKEVKESIRRQVENTYRDLTRDLPNLKGKQRVITELKILNLRTVYSPPHPIRTHADAVHYLRCTPDDVIFCICKHMFAVQNAVLCRDMIEWLGCPHCGTSVEYWNKL